MTLLVRGVVMVTVLAASCAGLHASTILYDTFGPGLTSQPGYGTGCSPPTCIQATPFIPTLTSRLDSVVAALGTYKPTATPGDQYTFSIWTDIAGKPGDELEGWALPATPSNPEALFSSSTLQPALFAGVQYWALFTTISVDPDIAWANYSGAPLEGVWVGSFPNVLSQVYEAEAKPALRINGVVPEPSTWTLTLAGLAILAGRFARRRAS